jgi:hypothetical protein
VTKLIGARQVRVPVGIEHRRRGGPGLEVALKTSRKWPYSQYNCARIVTSGSGVQTISGEKLQVVKSMNRWPRTVNKQLLNNLAAVGLTLCASFVARPISASGEKKDAQVPPGFSTSRAGSIHDFDYFVGGWTTHQHRLKARGVGSTEWEDFPAVQCTTPYLAGMATVDELYMPTKGAAGLTLRTFDVETHQWSIYWVSSKTGKLDPVPVVGGFEGSRGEFYADDNEDGRSIRVRYMWNELDHDHARWEQAYSYDNRTWETNWIADFQRGDPAKICEGGRPKR